MKQWLWVCLTVVFACSAIAEEVPDYNALVDSIDEPLMARSDTAEIQSIDLVTRSGVIGGYQYLFGPHTENLVVKMRGSNAGALELLREGMTVEVLYIEPQGHRIALEIEQLDADQNVLH
ncbi:MAG: hypothetical protein KDI36_01750 [Pseudomonadales bacterium]|nr:hypothetical protein [Pseudomonadales bacterium]